MKAAIWGTLALIASTSTHADDTVNPDVKKAQDQAAIAQANAQVAASNAAIASSAITQANAQAVAQQALVTGKLANDKSDIANVQSTIPQFDGTKYRMANAPAATAISATYNRLLAEQLSEWLSAPSTQKDQNVVDDLVGCSEILIYRPTLPAQGLAYNITNARLAMDWSDLKSASDDLSTSGPAAMALPTVAAVGAVADLFLNIAAAAKVQTTLGTQHLSGAENIINAAVFRKISGAGKVIFDPSSLVDLGQDFLPVKKICIDMNDSNATLLDKAGCTATAINTLDSEIKKKLATLKPLDPNSKKVDPNASLRAKLDTYGKLLAQAKTNQLAMFSADSSGTSIPFLNAQVGEFFHKKMKGSNYCLLSLKTISSDADTIVRDGTFSSYKLSIATTSNISWVISLPNGQIKKSGFKSLSTSWTKQDLGN